MKKLNVVSQKGHWMIMGLSGGRSLEILRQIPFPESEWPEVGEIEGAKEMHQALYDIWQTSDALEAENKKHGGDGLLFHTPFGDFATYSYEVIPAEDAARIANKLLKDRDAAAARMRTAILSSKGFGPKRLEQITRRYGHRFEDWPKELVKSFWAAEQKAQTVTQALQRGERAR